MGKKRQKLILPPPFPPEVPDEEIEVSYEDLQFVTENVHYAKSLSKWVPPHHITKDFARLADADEGALESRHEKKLRKRLENKENVNALEVHPVYALPCKTDDGRLFILSEERLNKAEENPAKELNEAEEDPSLVKAKKNFKRKKLRKAGKKAKKEVQQTQAQVLVEVKKDLTAEEANEKKKYKLAELGTALLADPESNIKNIKEMLEILKDGDCTIVILGLKSLLAVFKDIIPGYRIRLPSEREQEMKVSKTVKKMRFYESTLLSAYKAYVQKLIALQLQTVYERVAVHCLCTLIAAVPHFNFRDSLLAAVVKNISSQDDVVRKLCCSAVKSLFTDEGKHGGEATVEAVKKIAELVKAHNCQLHPDSIEVFWSLSFDEDLGQLKRLDKDNKAKDKKSKKRKGSDELNEMPGNNRKRTRKEKMLKTREEVNADYKAAAFDQDPQERRRMQSQTLSAVFQTFFRILKHAIESKSEASSVCGASGSHPLLAPCLNGIGKFSHLIDLDFMADLMQCLRKLAGNGTKLGIYSENGCQLTVSERLRCCVVAFKVMRNNLDALNVDLHEFFVQIYNLILKYQPRRDEGEVFAEALKIMLCDERQHDMQRAAAFIKRLATFSLCFRSAESTAALVAVKHLLQKNAKCRNLLENDAGGGSAGGAVAKFQPHVMDPNRSGALASVLWELNLLMKHYHPVVSSIASSMSTMNTSTNQVCHPHASPIQAYLKLSQEDESFASPIDVKRVNRPLSLENENKNVSFDIKRVKPQRGFKRLSACRWNENVVRKKLAEHFLLLRDMQENERLRSELDRTINLYDEYKKQKR
ncbi:binding protein [Perilla frutescens var. frutescens]|nr:binding protein [Perilla frutescens var. frutescens]